MVLLLFLHHEYIQEYTSLSSFEIYTLSMCYSHLFFEQIASHFKTGKIHAIPKDSSAATELAIDLGTLYFILSYGPAHFQSLNLFSSTNSPSVKPAHVEGEEMPNASLSPEDSLPTKTTSRYVLAEVDRFLQTDDSSKSTKDRHLPFKAGALPERWAFLKDYISHWVDRLGICSTDPTIVTSSLVLAHRLCRVSLLDSDGRYDTRQRARRPILPFDMQARNPVQDLSSMCRQMQDHWTPQRATEALHGFLGDRKVLIWHLIALWDQNAKTDDPEEPLDLQDLTRLPHMFPSGITAKAGNIQMLESQVRKLYGVFTEPPEEIHVIEQQWRAISDNVSSTMPALQHKDDNRVRQFTLESYLKRIWT
ncbi:hypothetical protein PG993_010914 [Apiospora rasikravindrae]|uniref:Uncharacterized protein n=1 Tax=Apiospora rasikravindrae TaxID=990691 RepID=A0ABR1SE93_9PEZI